MTESEIKEFKKENIVYTLLNNALTDVDLNIKFATFSAIALTKVKGLDTMGLEVIPYVISITACLERIQYIDTPDYLKYGEALTNLLVFILNNVEFDKEEDEKSEERDLQTQQDEQTIRSIRPDNAIRIDESKA